MLLLRWPCTAARCSISVAEKYVTICSLKGKVLSRCGALFFSLFLNPTYPPPRFSSIIQSYLHSLRHACPITKTSRPRSLDRSRSFKERGGYSAERTSRGIHSQCQAGETGKHENDDEIICIQRNQGERNGKLNPFPTLCTIFFAISILWKETICLCIFDAQQT